MLTTASQFTPRARPLQAQHASRARVVGAAGFRHQQQSRGFRFGLWSNYLDEEFQREVRRRQRMLKHKYADQINRRLSWENHPLAQDARHALKRMMTSYWHPHDPRTRGRFRDDVEPNKQRTPENEDGVRPGQNIEDVERGAINHLFYGSDEQPGPSTYTSAHVSWQSRPKRRRARCSTEMRYDYPIEHGEFVIDPITNRKVAKQSTATNTKNGGDIPVKTFKDYRSQFDQPVPSQQRSEELSDSSRTAGDLASSERADIDLKPDTPVAPEKPSRSYAPMQSEGFAWSHETAENQPSDHSGGNILERWDKQFQEAKPSHFGALLDSHPDRLPRSFEPSQAPDYSAEAPSRGQDALHRYEAALNEAHVRFDDLKPPQDGVDVVDTKSRLAGEISQRILGDSWPAAVDRDLSETSEVPGAVTDAEVSQSEIQQDRASQHSEPPGKPMGFTEEPVGPEVLYQYKPSIERLKPEDLDENIAKELQERYGPCEVKQFTAVRPPKHWKTPRPAAGEFSEPSDGTSTAQKYQLTDGLEELDAQKQNSSLDSLGFGGLRTGSASKSEVLEKLKPVKQGQGRHSNYRSMLDSLMEPHQRLSDAADEEAVQAIRSARAKVQQAGVPERKMTGNYVRDFPEEFEKSWTDTLSSAPAENTEADFIETEKVPDHSDKMDGGLEGAFGQPAPSRIQPALDRQPGQSPDIEKAESQPAEAQGWETSYDNETASPTQTAVAHQHKTLTASETVSSETRESTTSSPTADSSREMSREAGADPTDPSTVYKILAFDPASQDVTMAESTSPAPDFSSTLSPADALLRLSHPTKFFPHFAPLQAEGFEIIAGSGDVLIFRKGRPSAGGQTEDRPAETKPETNSNTAEHQPASERINPIDMTGRPRVMPPASANFASPTGYVNYENLPETKPTDLPPPPPPRVKYNIDLRRTEPVYSGPKESYQQRPKASLGKRLVVGGVWVAGISYGLGVVSEYFTTGGIDGMGPTGF